MVLVKVDSGAILVAPMKSRKSEEMVEMYQGLVNRLKMYDLIKSRYFG